MIITTKWNNWRNASIAKTNIVDNAKDGIYFFSANAFGLKGKLPGGKHSWAAIRAGSSWFTIEITDIETIEFQNANIVFSQNSDKYASQVIISDRDPSTMWFGNKPEVLHYSSKVFDFTSNMMYFPYPGKNIKLYKNNCNTYLSYLLWASNSRKHFKYIGFKQYNYWNKYYDV